MIRNFKKIITFILILMVVITGIAGISYGQTVGRLIDGSNPFKMTIGTTSELMSAEEIIESTTSQDVSPAAIDSLDINLPPSDYGDIDKVQQIIEDNISLSSSTILSNTITIASRSSIEITISPSVISSDGFDPNPYLYNRDGADLGTWTNVAPYTDTGLSPNMQYTYMLRVKDNLGDVSEYSSPASVYTLALDPINLTVDETTDTTMTVNIQGNPLNGLVPEYFLELKLNGAGSTGTNVAVYEWSTNNAITFSDLSTADNYELWLTTRNGDGVINNKYLAISNFSLNSPINQINTITITSRSSIEITISPSAISSDGLDPNPYLYNRDGADLGTWTNVAPYTDTGLAPNTQYTYKFRFKDSLGNISDYSSPASIYTLALDPISVAKSDITDNTMNISIQGNPINGQLPEYLLELKLKGAGTSGANIAVSDWSTSAAITFNGLNPTENYELWLTTRNGDGQVNVKYLIEELEEVSILNYEYDASNKLTLIRLSNGEIIQYQYDVNGNLIKTIRN